MLQGDRVQPPSVAEFKQLLVNKLNTLFTVITGMMQVVSSITGGRGGSNEAETENAKRVRKCAGVDKRERDGWRGEMGWVKTRKQVKVYIGEKKLQEWRRDRRLTHVITKLFHLGNNKRYAGLSFSLSFFPSSSSLLFHSSYGVLLGGRGAVL